MLKSEKLTREKIDKRKSLRENKFTRRQEER